MDEQTGHPVGGYEERLDRLHRIRAGAEPYKDQSSPADAAQAFQIEEMIDDVTAFARRNSGRVPDQVDLLISLVGFSPITTLLTYELLRPARVLVITSTAALDSVDVIHDHLVSRRGLRPRSFQHRTCEPTDPQSIYQIIKDALSQLPEPGRTRGYSVIDITGGRKVMSASAALAAWQLDLELCYLESEFDRVHQVSRPDTNRIHMLRNPLTIFGEQEMARALGQFTAGAFASAESRYAELAVSVREPVRARFMQALSGLYRCWCDLDIGDELARALDAVRAQMPSATEFLSADVTARVEGQLGFLGRLAAGDQQAMLLSYHLLGRHYGAVGRRDFAALLHYRTIEKCLSLRLEGRAPGFTCGRPDYGLLDPDPSGLADRYAAVARQVWQGSAGSGLPDRVALMDAALILHVLSDAQLRRAKLTTPGHLRELSALAEVRNQSVLAHGASPVSEESLRGLARMAGRMLTAYWELSSEEQPLHSLRDRLVFVRPEV